jgi:hypothetical protein
MDEHKPSSLPPEGVDHDPQQDVLTETTTLSYEPDAVVEETYHAWCKHFQKVPCISIRGDVDFIEPASKPGKWKKKRTVYLREWYKVKAWHHDDQGRMLIEYTFTGGPSHNQPTTQDQWVRPTTLFNTWSDVQLRRDFAAEHGHDAQ